MDLRHPNVVRLAAPKALTKELGVVGAAYFFRQFGTGQGNYTAERNSILNDYSCEKIIADVKN